MPLRKTTGMVPAGCVVAIIVFAGCGIARGGNCELLLDGVYITDPLYLPLKRGGLVCLPLDCSVGSLLNVVQDIVNQLFRKQSNCLSPLGETGER